MLGKKRCTFMNPLPDYRSYKNLPPLAGLCTIEEAMKPGLSVEECVRRLKRFHYCFKRLHEILTARITSEPIYELKTAFAHHAWLCAEHATAIRQRVSEMREPPLGLEEVPHEALEAYFDDIQKAPQTCDYFYGVYGNAIPALIDSLHTYVEYTNPLTDAPTRRLIKIVTLELNELASFGAKVFAELGQAAKPLPDYYLTLQSLKDIARGIDGTFPEYQGCGPLPRAFPQQPSFRNLPQRDERFTDPWNQGVNAEAFLYDESQPAKAKALMMLYKRIREIDVPEMMASIVTETKDKPWEYYRAMARQIWDEARHAMMGEVGFVALGVDWTKAKITWNWSYRLNTECTPLERHGVLYFIEQGLMPKTGKRYEYEVATLSGIPLMATIQDFDWADEVLHSQIGRAWYVTQFPSLKEAMDFGDQAWSKITSNWTTVRDQGLTKHENWWPAIYTQYCSAEGVSPDPKVLAFVETYEGKRADLHRRIPAE